MEGVPRPFLPNRPHWNYQRPPHFNQWRSRPPPPLDPHHFGPRSFRPCLFPNFNNPRPVIPIMNTQNQEYWCETCDKVFPAKILLDKHCLQHQKCNIDGCQFIAHPKIITKHIQMQHSTGLYKKIAVLNNPEEIQKWREERRKKYPTKANIEKKQAAVNEKIERGEKMGLGRCDDRRNHGNRNFSPGQKRRPNSITNENQPRSKYAKINNSESIKNEPQNNKNKEKKAFSKILPQLENRKLKPFAGIQYIVENDDASEELTEFNDFIEDDDNETKEIVSDDKEPAVCSALSSLLCNYGSSDDDDADESLSCKPKPDSNKYIAEEKNSITGNTTSDVKQNVNDEPGSEVRELKSEPQNVTQNCEDDDSGPEEVKNDKTQKNHDINEEENKVHENHKTHIKKKTETVRKNNFRRAKPKLPSTLLQKLLSREMQQERNIVLQCIRYIRKNNYFDKQNNST